MSVDALHRFHVEVSKLVYKFWVARTEMRLVPTLVCMSSACGVLLSG